MQSPVLSRAVLVLLLLVLVVTILYLAKPLFMPLTMAAVFAMLFMPITEWLEKKRWNHVIASLVSVVMLMLIVAGLTILLAWQISRTNTDLTALKQNIIKTIDKVQHYISSVLGISLSKQKKLIDSQTSDGGSISSVITVVMGSVFSILVKTVLTLVYMFFLLYFREHLKNFMLKLVSQQDTGKTKKIMTQSGKVVQQYLLGAAMIISALWIMYSIGFTIVGIHGAIFFAILCGLLEVIPFVGNLTGCSLTVIAALSQGGGADMVIGVLITYAVVQTIQFYAVSPIVLGDEVNINPLFIIIGLIAGDLLWGIAGMFLAIPVLGMTKIIFDNVETLKPYGYLIGQEKKKNYTGSFLKRIKKVLGRA